MKIINILIIIYQHIINYWMHVVYFDQPLGSAHSKRWSKSVFFMFFCMRKVKKRWKSEKGYKSWKMRQDHAKKCYWGLHSKADLRGKNNLWPAFGCQPKIYIHAQHCRKLQLHPLLPVVLLFFLVCSTVWSIPDILGCHVHTFPVCMQFAIHVLLLQVSVHLKRKSKCTTNVFTLLRYSGVLYHVVTVVCEWVQIFFWWSV